MSSVSPPKCHMDCFNCPYDDCINCAPPTLEERRMIKGIENDIDEEIKRIRRIIGSGKQKDTRPVLREQDVLV